MSIEYSGTPSRQRGLSAVEWLVVGAILLIGGSVLLSISSKDDAKVKSIEQRAAPLIGALEVYRAEHGRYPDRLAALVPRQVAVLPKCADTDGGPMPYLPDDARKSFQLVCPAGMFMKRGYSSATAKWSSFD